MLIVHVITHGIETDVGGEQRRVGRED